MITIIDIAAQQISDRRGNPAIVMDATITGLAVAANCGHHTDAARAALTVSIP